MSVDLTTLCKRSLRQILVDKTLLFALLEAVRIRAPSLFTVRINHVLARVTAMRLVLLRPIAAATLELLDSGLQNKCNIM